MKADANDLQTNIDNLKQQLIVSFEEWYGEEFEVAEGGAGNADYNNAMK